MKILELDRLADAITSVADARNEIPLDRLLSETALNILILTRIASNRIKDEDRRDDIHITCDRLVDLLRQAARRIPDDPAGNLGERHRPADKAPAVLVHQCHAL